MKKATASAAAVKPSHLFRITCAAKAWGPAHREYLDRLERGRIKSVDKAWSAAILEAAVRCTQRISDIDTAWHEAHAELVARAAHGRVVDVDQAHSWALEEEAERNRMEEIAEEQFEARRAEAVLEHDDEERIADIDEAHEAAIEENDWREDHGHTPRAGQVVPAGWVKSALRVQPVGDIQILVLPLKLVSTALLAAASGDIRYYLNGVQIHAVEGEVRVCGTDGHRLIVSRYAPGVDQVLPEWLTEKGVIIPRDDLAAMMPILTRNSVIEKRFGSEPSIVFAGSKDSQNMMISSANGFAQFRVKLVDGAYPNYQLIIGNGSAAFTKEDSMPMQATAINTKYLKGVADMAAKLGAKAVHSFVGSSDQTAAFFTFDGAPDTVLIVMGMRMGPSMTEGVVKLLGSNTVNASVSALRAHVTRTAAAMKGASGHELKTLQAKKSDYEARIDSLTSMLAASSNLKRLPAPQAQAA